MTLLKKGGVSSGATALETGAPSSGMGAKPLPWPRGMRGSAARALPARARSSEEHCSHCRERLSRGGSVDIGANHTENKFVHGALTT